LYLRLCSVIFIFDRSETAQYWTTSTNTWIQRDHEVTLKTTKMHEEARRGILAQWHTGKTSQLTLNWTLAPKPVVTKWIVRTMKVATNRIACFRIRFRSRWEALNCGDEVVGLRTIQFQFQTCVSFFPRECEAEVGKRCSTKVAMLMSIPEIRQHLLMLDINRCFSKFDNIHRIASNLVKFIEYCCILPHVVALVFVYSSAAPDVAHS
jgi:hypothetical protein